MQSSDLTLSELDKIRFLQRLKQLQHLCSGSNPSYPRGLLCVPGPDGRGNKGSYMILKYLFQFAVGKELFEGNLDDRLEPLEEMVLLIQETSLSIVVTAEAKRALEPFLSVCSFVTIYCSPNGITEEVEEYEARKAADFKRMMVECVPPGGVVEVPVPLGYDSVLDIENWSIMRSFALESLLFPTGFFTSRYTVIDVTEIVEILFRCVDGYVLARAVTVVKNSIVPNVYQILQILSGRGSKESRLKLTIDELGAPLDFLFEFGELESVFPVDPLLKPVVLFGPLTNSIGCMPGHVQLAAPWKSAVMPAETLHVVIEGCEPSSGIRWCRTYFTRRGRSVVPIADPESLVDVASPVPAESPSVFGSAIASDIERLETLYTLLWESLRAAVRDVFGKIGPSGIVTPSVDVVSAGGHIKAYIESFLRSNLGGGFASTEKLRIHMDCMNGLGQMCKLEDVEDIGGQCFVFLRVSVHGIATSSHTQPVAVAVGDTFVYSPQSSQVRSALRSSNLSISDKNFQDAFCLTHAVPYMFATFGFGAEEAAAHKLMHCAGSPHLLALMGLGSVIEVYGSSSAYTYPLLTDHPSNPYFLTAELTFFERGFMFQRLNGATLPGVISFDSMVDRMWMMDMSEVLNDAVSSPLFGLKAEADNIKNCIELPEGMVVVLQLKESHADYSGHEEKAGSEDSIPANPFDSFLPSHARANYVAFVVRADTSSSYGYYTRTASIWQRAIRTNEIPEHRGHGPDTPDLPAGILSSFLALYDYWGVMAGSGSAGAQDLMATANIPLAIQDESPRIAAEDVLRSAQGPLCVPGAGFFALKSLFTLSENARLCISETDMMPKRSISSISSGRGKKSVVVVVGLIGCAVLETSLALISRLPDAALHVVADCSDLDLVDDPNDSHQSGSKLSDIANDIANRMSRASGSSTEDVLLLSLVAQPSMVSDLPLFMDYCAMLAAAVGGVRFDIKCVVSIVASHFLVPSFRLDENRPVIEQYYQHKRLGEELFSAALYSLCRRDVADIVLCIDSSAFGAGFSSLRKHVRETKGSDREGPVAYDGELPLFRLRPPAVRLEDDAIELVSRLLSDKSAIDRRDYSKHVFQMTNLTNMTLFNPLRKIAAVETATAVGEEVIIPRVKPSYFHEESTGFIASELLAVPEWTDKASVRDFEMVMKCLRVVFPKAKVSATSFADVWTPPPLAHGVRPGTIKRVFQLAAAKAAASKQYQCNRDRLSSWLQRDLDPSMLKCVQKSLATISGFITLSPGSSLADTEVPVISPGKMAIVDACADFISVRFTETFLDISPLDKSKTTRNKLVVAGVLDKTELNFLDSLFAQCYLQPLSLKRSIGFSDLTTSQLQEIQEIYSFVELPGGWWFDGNAYLDMSGTKRKFRPDIEELAKDYISRINAQTDSYNAMLELAGATCR